MKPELKQFGNLTEGDFATAPVWVGCHTLDYDEPWYDDTDEETFRPWTGALPVDPAESMFLVKASFRLADGRGFEGFVTPAPFKDAKDLGAIQPHIFVAGTLFGFWGGMPGVSSESRSTFYSAVGGAGDDVFPIYFEATSDSTLVPVSGEIAGFYRTPDLGKVVVEL